jgi:O-methyltransferase
VTGEADAGAEVSAMADLITPMAVRVAATLRIADHVAAGRRTAAELAETANADADALDRMLRHLVHVGVFLYDESGRYALTAIGEALRDDHPSGVRARLDIEGALGRADLSFVELLHSVRTGEPAFPARYGRAFWDDVGSNPGRSASFDAIMSADVGEWARAILPAYDWGSLGHVVDIGGGDGTLLIAMLSEHPALLGTVVELPGPAEAARAALAAAGLADRAGVVAGSFFDPLPMGGGGYLLCSVIHNWDDEAARNILRRCAEAAGAHGRVFVVEKIGSDGEAPPTQMDLRVLAYMGGRERGLAEISALAADAGLTVAAVHPAGTTPVVELWHAGPVRRNDEG